MRNLFLILLLVFLGLSQDASLIATSKLPGNERDKPSGSKITMEENEVGTITETHYAGAAFVFGVGNTWAGNSSSAGAPDGVGGLSVVFPGNSSANLFLRNFNFDLPCNAIIQSVTFRVTRRNAANTPAAGGVVVNGVDKTISVFNPLTLEINPFNNSIATPWLQDDANFETITYTDATWGETLTAEMINNNRFGLIVEVMNTSSSGAVRAIVDAVEMEVCYDLNEVASEPIDFTVTKGDACFDQGEIIINATGGTGNYEYSINTGASWSASNTFQGLSVGSYIVAVRNTNQTCMTEFRFVSLSGDERAIQPGDALVACATYPGNRVTLAIEKLQPINDLFNQGEVGYDISPLIPVHPYEWTVEQLGGEVFSATVDQDRNIYAATSSMYDLTPGGPVPLYISRIDAVTAQPEIIATLPGSNGAVGIDYDSLCNQLYVANASNGIIYVVDPVSGTTTGTFDPLTPDNGAAGIAPLGERVMAVAVNSVENRLYYSMWNSDYNRTGIRNTIRSVAIDPNSCSILGGTDQLEITLPWTQEYGDPLNSFLFSMPVTDIDFSIDGGTMIMGESGFDSTIPNDKPHNARALRYLGSSQSWVLQTTLPPGNINLQHELGEFSAGLNSRGGVAFANSGFDSGQLCALDNDEFMIATADALRGADCNSLGCIYGLQYLPITGGTPTESVLLDIGRDIDSQQKGVFGDVDIIKGCLDPIFCCPDLSTMEPDLVVCPGDPTSDLIFDTQADSLALVYHTVIPPDSASVYTNGIPIDTTEVLGGSASLSLAGLPAIPGIYYVYAIVHPTPPLPTCRPYDMIVVNIRTLPVVDLNDPADQCIDGSNMDFVGSPLPGVSSSGSFSTTALAGLVDNGDGTASINIAQATVGIYDVTYTFTDDFGCINSSTVEVEIYDKPTVTINDPADECIDQNDMVFSGTPVPFPGTFGVFTTTASSGFVDNGDGSANLDISTAGAGTYDVTYTYTDLQGCFNSAVSSVTVHPLPVVTINDPADECLNEGPFLFSGTPIPGGLTTGFFSTASSGLTDNGNGTASLDADLAGPGVHTVSYNFIDLNGCTDFDLTSVEVFDTLPNVIITPTSICGNPIFGTNVINLNTLITTGPLTGTWADTDGSGGLVGSTFTANPSIEGNSYNFTYTLLGPGPTSTDCQIRSFVVTIDVVYCNLDLALIKNTNQTNPVSLNELVTYNYTICNQGFTIVDSVEVTDYLTSCYGFTPNNGWVASGSFARRTLTVANGGLPSGGLPTPAQAPNNCITIPLDLVINCGDPNGLLTYAELTGHRDTSGNLEDFDSTPGSDSPAERSVLPGGPDDDSFVDLNQDDHDPGTMPVVDVALTSLLNVTGPSVYGQAELFDIQVINQGNVDLANVQITNYIPCGFQFDPSSMPTWNFIGGNAVTVISSLDAGEIVNLSLSLILIERPGSCPYQDAWLNETEVSQIFNDALINYSLQDFDSRSNNFLGDDAGGLANSPSDNSIVGDGTGAVGEGLAATDEDDHDPALLDLYDLELTKIVTNSGPYGQDSIVTYQLMIVNQGNLTASNIEITDAPVLGLNFVSSDASFNANVNETSPGVWRVISLDPDQIELINVTFQVTNTFQGLLLTNSVEITEDDGNDVDSDPNLDNTQDDDGDGNADDDDEDSATIDLVQFYDLALDKVEVSTGPYVQSDIIVYNLVVTNEGTLNAADIRIMDMPAPGLEFVSDNSSSLANVSVVAPLIYEIASLNFGDSQAVELTFRVNSTYQADSIINAGQIIQDDGDDRDSDPDQGPGVDENGDQDPDDDDEDILILDILQTYDLSLQKVEVSSGPYVPGDFITFRIDIMNTGTLNASNTEFIDVAGPGLTFVNDNSISNPNVDLVAFQRYRVNTLNFGNTESLTLTYRVDLGFQGLQVTNAAEIVLDDGSDIDSDPDTSSDVDEDGDGDGFDDDEDERIIDVLQTYDLSIVKTLLTTGQIFPGDDVSFSITITNEGTLNAANIEITENPDADLTFISNTTGANANITEVTNTIYTIANLPINTSETFQISYHIEDTYFAQSIENLVEITLDDGDDIDSDPDTSIDVDEDGDGNGDDDDESLSVVPVIIGFNLGDYVWHDLDGDGIQDSNEDGVPNAIVRLYTKQGYLVDVKVTDSDGFYLFELVFPGDYFIRIDLFDDFTSTLPFRGGNPQLDNNLTDSQGPGTTNIFRLNDEDLSFDLGLYKCAKIGENVWFDYNENDKRDETENGINGMVVELYRFGTLGVTLFETQVTGHKPNTGSDDGYFKFCVPPGRYYLKFLNPPATLVTVRANSAGNDELDSDVTNKFGSGTTDDFTVKSGDEICNIGAGYTPMGTIGDYVWMDENNNGRRDNNEVGVSGVIIRAFNAEGNELASTVSDEAGNYIIDYLVKDSYYLKVDPPSGMSFTAANSGGDESLDSDIDDSNGLFTTQIYQVNPGQHIANVDIGLVYSVLPVEWQNIWGEHRGRYNYVEWSIASEVNVSHYVVQKSNLDDKFEWNDIARIESSNIAELEKNYSYKDYDLDNSGIVYYRVEQFDFNGRSTHSKIVTVVQGNAKPTKPVLNMYPNPAVNELNMHLDLFEEYNTVSANVYNQQGKLIMKNLFSLKDIKVGSQKLTFNIESMATGVYTIHVELDANRIIRKLVVVK